MSLLIPGYQEHVQQAREQQAAELRLDRLPWSAVFASTQIHLIQTAEEAEAFVAQIRKSGVSMLGIDTEFSYDRAPILMPNKKEFTDPSTIRPQVCSIVAWCGAKQATSAQNGDLLIRGVFDLRRPETHAALQELFSLGLPWVAHSAGAEYQCLWACGIKPPEHLLFDTYIAAACLNNGRFQQQKKSESNAEDIARDAEIAMKVAHITSLVGQCEHYGIPHPFTVNKDVMRKKFIDLGPDGSLDEDMLAYAVSDAEWALSLYFKQREDIERAGLGPHLERVEFPLVSTLARMELAGLPFDKAKASEYLELCQELVVSFARQLEGYGIQPGSRGSFLAAMGREGLLDHFYSYDSKPSTRREVLKRVEEAGMHPAVRLFRLHRHFQRLVTDLTAIFGLVSEDGRIRCSLRQIGAKSGRIISVRPNLVGMDGRLRPIIATVLATVLIELDYSQIEVGVAGAVWSDAALIEQYNTGDAYAAMAQSFFREQITEEERRMSPQAFKKARPDLRKKCKSLMLGTLFGMGSESLGRSLNCSTDDADDELRRFFQHYPGTAAGANLTIEAALVNGYGVTATGFRRLFGVGDHRLVRQMRNHPVQGSAAAIFKMAIARIDQYFRGTETRLLIPRHDSILIETPEGTQSDVIAVCKLFMIQAVREIFPRLQPRVDHKLGKSWPTEKTLEEFHRDEVVISVGSVEIGVGI